MPSIAIGSRGRTWARRVRAAVSAAAPTDRSEPRPADDMPLGRTVVRPLHLVCCAANDLSGDQVRDADARRAQRRAVAFRDRDRQPLRRSARNHVCIGSHRVGRRVQSDDGQPIDAVRSGGDLRAGGAQSAARLLGEASGDAHAPPPDSSRAPVLQRAVRRDQCWCQSKWAHPMRPTCICRTAATSRTWPLRARPPALPLHHRVGLRRRSRGGL